MGDREEEAMTMAEVTFTPDELAKVDAICAELDPATEELTAPHLSALESDDRAYLPAFFRRALRAELIMGLLARASADAAILHGAATPLAAQSMLEGDFHDRYSLPSGVRKSDWQCNFGRAGHDHLGTVWTFFHHDRDDRVCPAAMTAFYALLDIAHDRMFGTFEDQLMDVDLRSDE